MKAYFWLPVFCVFVITGCANTQNAKKDKVDKIRKLAEAYLAEEKYVPAYRELMNALTLDPKDPHIHYALGIFYYKREKLDRAIESYQKALELKHDFSTARNNLGIVYMEQQQWDKAIETLTCLTEDYLYASLPDNGAIVKLDPNTGKRLAIARTGSGIKLQIPAGLVWTSDGVLYAADRGANRIWRLTTKDFGVLAMP